ncbi:MAG TPA: ATP-grasp domain-containing protein [Bacteroidota bacterium]|nr:ATP-grasp domain-containing protein [Bacteroidota bacterium]
MARKTRIAILYNEPVVGTEAGRKYIGENGTLQDGPPRRLQKNDRGRPLATQALIDLSEIGVMDEMEDIKSALNSLGYKTTIFNVDSNFHRLVDYLREERPDLVFNLVESVENESAQEMNVAGVYELMNIPFTGAGPLALGTALNKPRVKEILGAHGITTPRFAEFGIGEKIALRDGLAFPLIVKPSREDASVGIDDCSVVYSLSDLRKRVRFIQTEYDQSALVEEYIDGRELNVAILGNSPAVALPISEIDFSGLTAGMHKIVSYEAKWIHGTVAYEGTKGVCPAALPATLEARIKETALRAYRLIGCRDYARVDFRLTKEGVPYVLEVNPNPDISDDAGFARSARAQGYTFPQIVGRIVESALERRR